MYFISLPAKRFQLKTIMNKRYLKYVQLEGIETYLLDIISLLLHNKSAFMCLVTVVPNRTVALVHIFIIYR